MTQKTSSLTITSWQYEKQQVGISEFLADWAHNKRKTDEKTAYYSFTLRKLRRKKNAKKEKTESMPLNGGEVKSRVRIWIIKFIHKFKS